jgi:hypothetical protein
MAARVSIAAACTLMLAAAVPAEGWPPRVLLITYMLWLVTLAWQALKLRPDGVYA